jgi:hypothetical protein
MGCGDKYASMLTVHGWGIDNPTGGKPWASEADVQAWRGVATTVFGAVRERWNSLMRFENARKDWTQTEALREYVENYEREYANLPDTSWWVVAGADSDLERVLANAQVGVCALQLLTDAMAHENLPELPVPTRPDAKKLIPPSVGAGFGVAIAVAVVGGLYFLSRDK